MLVLFVHCKYALSVLQVAPENAYQHLSINERLTWKRCSMVYGLLTSIMFTVHYSLAPENRYAIADAILLVAAVYVQLIFLCITYFSDGQQLLRNMVGMGTYNPMADSLDLYFTIDSIVSKMDAYILSISSVWRCYTICMRLHRPSFFFF